jgi:hypothetical protein
MLQLFCLNGQPAPKDEDFVALGNQRYMPEGLRDREAANWFPLAEVGRQAVIEIIERQLARLSRREEVLRRNLEAPARAGAEAREQVLRGPDGALFARLQRLHRQDYLQAYQTFVKGRKETQKTGMVPGAPVVDPPGSGPSRFVPAAPDPAAAAAAQQVAEAATAARTAAAATVAPGAGDNPIAGTPGGGDDLRRRVRPAAAQAGPTPAPQAAAGDPGETPTFSTGNLLETS